MPLVTWSNKYSVENLKIDSQHQKLINIINEMHDALSKGKGNDVIKKSLEELYKYTVEHFTEEEAMLQLKGYSQLAIHKAEHQKFTQQIKKYIEQYNSGRSMLSIDVLNFCKSWLVDHIMLTDKQYVAYIK